MDTAEIILHASDFSEETKKSLHEYIAKNLSGKLDSYIKKHEKPNSPVRVELTVSKGKEVGNGDKIHLYNGKLVLSVGPKIYRSDREAFKDVKDLVMHLFTHVKEQMAK